MSKVMLFVSKTLNGNDGGLDCETYECGICHQQHDVVKVIFRVLADTFGPWPVFRVNGFERVWDASTPERFGAWPRDARDVPEDLMDRLWHDNSGFHVFGAAVDIHRELTGAR